MIERTVSATRAISERRPLVRGSVTELLQTGKNLIDPPPHVIVRFSGDQSLEMEQPHEPEAGKHCLVRSLQVVSTLVASCGVLNSDRRSLRGAPNSLDLGVAKSNGGQAPDTDQVKLEYRGMNCRKWSL
jgi:hypothetical protein